MMYFDAKKEAIIIEIPVPANKYSAGNCPRIIAEEVSKAWCEVGMLKAENERLRHQIKQENDDFMASFNLTIYINNQEKGDIL